MKKSLLLLVLAIAATITSASAREWVHPGCTTSKAALDRLKQKVEAKEDPWYKGWQLMTASSKAKSSYTTVGSTTGDIGGSDGTRQRCSKDCQAAYYNLLEWWVTGNEAYAKCAVRIINKWTQTVSTSNGELFMLPIKSLVEVADMALLYDGWAETDREALRELCRTVLYPACKGWLGSCDSWPGWDGPANYCCLLLGIFLEDEAIYNEAIRYYKYGASGTGYGGGCVTNMVCYDTGQTIEMGRDIPHAEIGLNVAAKFCQAVMNQSGDDLFSFPDGKCLLIKAHEYLTKWQLEHVCDDWQYYEGCTNAPRYFNSVSIRYPHRISGYPSPEIIYNYAVENSIEVPYTEQWLRLRGYTENGWEASCHPYVIYTGEKAAQGDAFKPIDRPLEPLAVQAVAGIGSVRVSWTRPDWHDVNGAIIQRSTSPTANFATVKEYTMDTEECYVDSPLVAGTTYYYRVALRNNSGTSQYSEAVSATPAAGQTSDWADWKLSNIGTFSHQGSATWYDGDDHSLRIVSYANEFDKSSDNVTFFCQKLSGDATVVCRVADYHRCDGRTDGFGIMIRASLGANSKAAMLFQSGTDARHTYLRLRKAAGQSTSGADGHTHTFPGGWMKLVKQGDTITAYQCNDGRSWAEIGTATLTGLNSYYVGLFASRGYSKKGADESTTALFDHISITPAGATLDQPTLNARRVSSASATLAWDAIDGATTYTLLRANSADGTYTVIADALTATTFTDNTLSPARTYYYILRAKSLATTSESQSLALTTTEPSAPQAPANVSAATTNAGTALIACDPVAEATSYTLMRAESSDGDFTAVKTVKASGMTTTAEGQVGTTDAASVGSTFYYKYVATNEIGQSDPSDVVALTVEKIDTIAGSAISSDNASKAKQAFDFDATTTFEATNKPNGVWVGLDLGEGNEAVVSQIRYYIKSGSANLLVGGIFQASNNADFSDAVVLGSIASTPTSGKWVALKPYSTRPYRYLRYVAPDGSYGVITDLYFRGTRPSVVDGISELTLSSSSSPVVRTDYFDLSGRRLTSQRSRSTASRMLLVRTTHADGTTETQKIVY